MLARSIARGDAPLAEVLADLSTAHAQLWIAHEGDDIAMAMLTQCGERVCHIWHLGGREPSRWLHLIEDLKARAKERGFHTITLEGRRGWQRLLAPYGFRPVADLLECRL